MKLFLYAYLYIFKLLGLMVWSSFAFGHDVNGIERVMEYRENQIALNGSRNSISNSNAIIATEMVTLNGIDHAITIRGEHRDNPAVLFLHGGPGWPSMPWSYKYFRAWEKKFTVIQWDQRGAGKTFCANPDYDPSDASFEDYLSDAEAMVGYLREYLNKEKIIIFGQSWGSLLGVHLVKKRPGWISAYVGSGQIFNSWEHEKDGFAFALGKAYALGDEEGLQDLSELQPYPGGDNFIEKIFVQRTYIEKYGGTLVSQKSVMDYYLNAFFHSPDYSLADWECFFKSIEGNNHQNLLARQFKKDSDIGNLQRLGFKFDVPMFFFLGDHDKQVSTRLGIQYFLSISAPLKRLIMFENSAHGPFLEEPEKFIKSMEAHVLPVIQKSKQVSKEHDHAK